jgi:hypothetical protein
MMYYLERSSSRNCLCAFRERAVRLMGGYTAITVTEEAVAGRYWVLVTTMPLAIFIMDFYGLA